MPEQFKHLFSPMALGKVQLKNRIVWTAHDTNMAENHLPGENMLYYHTERARGGCGLIIMEATSVHPTADIHGTCVHAFDPRVVPLYRRIADSVHEHGTRMLVQLFHSGVHMSFHKSRRAAWGPSAIPSSVDREIPHVMDKDDIREIVDGFGRSAEHVVAGGMDGVELHAAHSYLISQFWSPAYNKRTDEYGGSLANRLRFALEVIDRCRQAVGPDKVLGMRISGDEFLPGGLGLKDMQEIAAILEGTGKLDYISVSLGTYFTRHMIIAPMVIPQVYQLPLAVGIKEALRSLPVIAVGRIEHPALAEQVLSSGAADLVGMTRSQIADPELAIKSLEGRTDDIRHCVACNQLCREMFFLGKHIACTVNPAAGREKELGISTLAVAPRPRKIVVVGGGPAGLKAAEMAARRGHKVVLLEKESELGGQINLARRLPYRDRLREMTEWMERQIAKLGVQVVLGAEATAESVLALQPEAVVVATGSVPSRTAIYGSRPDLPEISGSDSPHVLSSWDVINGNVVGQHVVIIDEDGHHQATGTAEFLADRGKQVEIVTSLQAVGIDLIGGDQPLVYERLVSKGVVMTPTTRVKAIHPNSITVYHAVTRVERVISPVDTVVMITGNRAQDSLYHALKGRVPELHRVGDCVAPRRAPMAVHEGDLVGRRL